MTDDQRPPETPETPDVPDARPSDPGNQGREELSRPDDENVDRNRGGVEPEVPGEERAAPDGAPATDVPPDDPGAAAVDDHVAGKSLDRGRRPVEDVDAGVDRDDLNAPNQGFRPGG